MNFLDGLTNLTNWFGNVIMPTLAGLLFVFSVLRFSRGAPFQYSMYAGFAALMVSGILRASRRSHSSGPGTIPDADLGDTARADQLVRQCFPAGLWRAASGDGHHALRRSWVSHPSRRSLGAARAGGNGVFWFIGSSADGGILRSPREPEE